ncbi:MAG: DUF7689 domain-containing protein [Acidimicrobiales bacterium]
MYNCFAWAAGDTSHWWSHQRFWPSGVTREHTLQAYQAAFETLGYSRCNTGDLEPGYEKVVLYANRMGPQHAARQLPDGRWTSKLGEDIDIRHMSVHDVAGGLYGEPTLFLRRPIPVEQERVTN